MILRQPEKNVRNLARAKQNGEVEMDVALQRQPSAERKCKVGVNFGKITTKNSCFTLPYIAGYRCSKSLFLVLQDFAN